MLSLGRQIGQSFIFERLDASGEFQTASVTLTQVSSNRRIVLTVMVGLDQWFAACLSFDDFISFKLGSDFVKVQYTGMRGAMRHTFGFSMPNSVTVARAEISTRRTAGGNSADPSAASGTPKNPTMVGTGVGAADRSAECPICGQVVRVSERSNELGTTFSLHARRERGTGMCSGSHLGIDRSKVTA